MRSADRKRTDQRGTPSPGPKRRNRCHHLRAAWTSGDFDTARSTLHDNVSFVGPLGTADGIDDRMRGLQGLKQIVESSAQHKVIMDGDDVCIIYDLVTNTPAGTIPTAGWFQVRDGKIASIRVFFDARPLDQGR